MLVELRREEPRPAHLPIAHDIDAGLFLVADRQIHGVVQHLGEVRRPELAALRGIDTGHEPGGTRV